MFLAAARGATDMQLSNFAEKNTVKIVAWMAVPYTSGGSGGGMKRPKGGIIWGIW
jgi:hypothetical protein